jgi:hypothetical protein
MELYDACGVRVTLVLWVGAKRNGNRLAFRVVSKQLLLESCPS